MTTTVRRGSYLLLLANFRLGRFDPFATPSANGPICGYRTAGVDVLRT